MSKICDQVERAVRNRQPFKGGNTVVSFVDNRMDVHLHGNRIYTESFPTVLPLFSWCGWSGPTTRSRLNAIARGLGIHPGFCVVGGVGSYRDKDGKVTPI